MKKVISLFQLNLKELKKESRLFYYKCKCAKKIKEFFTRNEGRTQHKMLKKRVRSGFPTEECFFDKNLKDNSNVAHTHIYTHLRRAKVVSVVKSHLRQKATLIKEYTISLVLSPLFLYFTYSGDTWHTKSPCCCCH